MLTTQSSLSNIWFRKIWNDGNKGKARILLIAIRRLLNNFCGAFPNLWSKFAQSACEQSSCTVRICICWLSKLQTWFSSRCLLFITSQIFRFSKRYFHCNFIVYEQLLNPEYLTSPFLSKKNKTFSVCLTQTYQDVWIEDLPNMDTTICWAGFIVHAVVLCRNAVKPQTCTSLLQKTRYKKALSTENLISTLRRTVMGDNVLFLFVIFITLVAFGSGKQ